MRRAEIKQLYSRSPKMRIPFKMSVETIFLKSDTLFSTHISEWAVPLGIAVSEFDFKSEDYTDVGLLLINENQDIDKELYELHSLFDVKHIPTQKIDINGTLQVAVSNFEMWLRNNKCKKILMMGSDKLVKNENLGRFLARIQSSTIS